MGRRAIRVGIVGAGLGGLAAAIAVARAGADVTVLESAPELGEIGAGIQMLPNVSRFLIRWGVDQIIGDNLVEHDECCTYAGPEPTLVARSDPKLMAKQTGFPWWVVRRDHLHAGLTKSARLHGAKLIVGARVVKMEELGEIINIQTQSGDSYEFDMVIGADGIKSFVRGQLFPGTEPVAPSKVAAYRGVLSCEKIMTEIPEARQFLRGTMDVWSGPRGYIMTYPISGGKELNVVTAFCKDDYVTKPEAIDIDEFRGYYQDYSPVIQKVLKLVNYTQRWPLLQMPPMKSRSNERRNIVLMGDAAHCMQNHMAQGAATAIEDGAFLGRVISEAVRGTLSITQAVELYEQRRIPKASLKQQHSLISGIINMAEEGIEKRNNATLPEIRALQENPFQPAPLSPTYRSWQYYCSAASAPGIFYYDAEGDADNAVLEYLQSHGQASESDFMIDTLEQYWRGFIHDNGDTTIVPSSINQAPVAQPI